MTAQEHRVDPPRTWTRAEVLAWCQAHNKPAHLFLDTAPPPNPVAGHPAPFVQAAKADRQP